MPPDAADYADTRAWFSKAYGDLRVAEFALTTTPPLYDQALFHCQQAVEKVLKGFLFWHDVPFRRTHDLVELGQLCVGMEAQLESLLRRAAPLTQYAWRARYPDVAQEPTYEEAAEALTLAREVVEVVLQRLPPEVRP